MRREPSRESAKLATAITGPSAANTSVKGDCVIAKSTTEPTSGAMVAITGKWNGGAGSGGRGAAILARADDGTGMP